MRVLGFGVCRARCVGHDCAMFAGMLGRKLLALYCLFFVYREGVLGQTTQLHLGLVQLHPALILGWRPNEQAQAPVSVQQC